MVNVDRSITSIVFVIFIIIIFYPQSYVFSESPRGLGNIKPPECLPQAPPDRNSAPARPRPSPLRPLTTTVPADRAVPGHTSPFPSRVRAALQALVALSAPAGGPRADRPSDASTLSVAGGRTSARKTITLPHAEHAVPMTPKTRHSSTLHGVHRELPRPAFVHRVPPPAGATFRFRGRGRTARCHPMARCQHVALAHPLRPRRWHEGDESLGELLGRQLERARARHEVRGSC